MEFKVEGMSCQGCVASVRRIVAAHLGTQAEQVEVELESGRVRAEGAVEPEVVDRLVQALAQAGFAKV